jgi:Metal binding domain of Ada
VTGVPPAHDGPAAGEHYILTGPDGRPVPSPTPGQYGGNRATRVYGRLDCPAALRALARGQYAPNRVFFADELTAIAAGYRPCAVCLPGRYQAWKARQSLVQPSLRSHGVSLLPALLRIRCLKSCVN